MNTTTERDSKFELLRIIAMFFVVIGHLVLKGTNTVGLPDPYSYDKDGVLGVLLYSCCVGGGKSFCNDNWMVWGETY